MSGIFNCHCDESGHQENYRQKLMLLVALWCHLDKDRLKSPAFLGEL